MKTQGIFRLSLVSNYVTYFGTLCLFSIYDNIIITDRLIDNTGKTVLFLHNGESSVTQESFIQVVRVGSQHMLYLKKTPSYSIKEQSELLGQVPFE